MASYSTSDFRKGLKVQLDREPYLIIEMEFMKPGKGQAVYKCKFRNLISGRILDKNYRSGDSIEAADVTEQSVQYLYQDGTYFHFMDPESYEQIPYPIDRCKDIAPFMKEGSTATVVIFEEKVLDITIPNSVELAVAKTDPGLKGDTASGGSKPAELETGGVVNVPLFINEGEIIQIDTRTGEYMGRA